MPKMTDLLGIPEDATPGQVQQAQLIAKLILFMLSVYVGMEIGSRIWG